MFLKFVYIMILMMMIWRIYPLTYAQYYGNKVIAKAGCNSTCGNVSIPYPFGMHDSTCFLSEWFEIECRNNTTSYLKHLNLEVILIDLAGFVWITSPIYRGGQCERNETGITLGEGPFVYSDVYNFFAFVGCQSYGFLLSNESEVGGCVSMCDDHEKNGKIYDMDVASCLGKHCCKTSMPSYLSEYKVSFGNLSITGKETEERTGCTYALIRADFEKFVYNSYGGDKFNRSLWFLSLRDLKKLHDVPAVLEWEITIETLNNLVFNLSTDFYARCELTNVTSAQPRFGHSGWRCKCPDGFEGNPYIIQGCTALPVDHSDNKKPKWAVIGVSSSLGTIILLLGLWWLHKVVKKRIAEKRKQKFFKQNGGLLLEQRLSSGEVSVDKIRLFSLKDLENATDCFNVNRVLGKGGQGTVYKGMLVDGNIVAVKKFKVNGKVEEFINEFVILSQINHRNVVKLIGSCLETEIPLLVYEFIPNGNLFEYLHQQNEDLPMTWDMRLRIATEVAGALFYLHYAAAQPIYHRDIKSTNILLDGKYRAKVADFGASRMVSIEATHLTTNVQGTFGYLDPEYFHTGQLTEKSDVYSFGVVLVELLTGQKPISSAKQQELKSLASYFLLCMEENRLFDIIDERVVKEGEKEDIIVVADLARRCLALNGKKRPTMKDVTLQLESIQNLENKLNAQEQQEEHELAGVEDYQIWAAYSTTTNSGQTSDSKASTLEIMPFIK